MGRWEPNTRNRLERAALDMFIEHGFEGATVSEIAARAGLTERTFFRHFADKREVLFGGQTQSQEMLTGALLAAPADEPPLDTIAEAFARSARDFIEARRPLLQQRQQVIDAHETLREREMLKLSALSKAIAGALRNRGLSESAATLTAESGVTIFKVAFDRWLDPTNPLELAPLIGETLAQLKAVLAAS